MLDMSKKALVLSNALDKSAYDLDEKLRFALTHLVQVIGEAARLVSTNFQESHPQIPWREIIGMRHHIVHDYLNVDEDVVWQVVHQDLPSLVELLEKIFLED